MKYTIILLLLLAGCSTVVPVKRKFPEAPAIMLKSCDELKKIEKENPTLSEVIRSVNENYMSYHECSIKHESWVEWYKTQKNIFEDSNK